MPVGKAVSQAGSGQSVIRFSLADQIWHFGDMLNPTKKVRTDPENAFESCEIGVESACRPEVDCILCCYHGGHGQGGTDGSIDFVGTGARGGMESIKSNRVARFRRKSDEG